MKSILNTAHHNRSLALLLDDFAQITKARLSISVVFSSIAGYLLGAQRVDTVILMLLALGGYFMVGASNAFNQIIERDLGALMKRTQNRPIPAGRMSMTTALTIAVIFTVLGLATLYVINPKTAFFGAISIFLYTRVYTPLKTKTPLAVFIGAFPGAIPFLLGWVAATNDFGIEPGMLFMLQFFWQFPHFWAIAWVLEDDYKRAGFNLLPTGKKGTSPALLIIIYTVCTVIISLIPAIGVTGKLYLMPISAFVVALLGVGMLLYALRLFKRRDNRSARQLMLVSVLYITLVQVVYVIDKFLH